MSKTSTRVTALALSAAAVVLLLLPATGQAGTIFGSRLNHDPANSGECESLGPCTIVSFIHPSEPNGDPYSGGAPVSGVITSFRIRATVDPEKGATQVTFRLADISRPDPNDESNALATATGIGPTVTIQPSEGEVPITQVAGRLPVKQGQHLAIDGTNVQATVNDSGDEFSYIFAPQLVAGAGARGSTKSTGELLVQATIEPDADNDGFGDETQDQCPSQAATQGPCDTAPPVVSGLKVTNGKISYSLSEAATVQLKIEKKSKGRKAGKKCVKETKGNRTKKACTRFTPVDGTFGAPGNAGANQVSIPKKLSPGTYRLTMTARDAAGNVSTKVTAFKVAGKKKGKKAK
jgi:hypothetical protein